MKDIYDEAIEDLKNGTANLYSYQVLQIIKALERAKKVEELLGLYQKRDRNIDHLTCSQIAKLDDEIDELEKELEEK